MRNLEGNLIAKEISVLACSAKLKGVFFGEIYHKVVSDNRRVCDTFFNIIECDNASYVDDNTLCNFDFNLDNVISNLEKIY